MTDPTSEPRPAVDPWAHAASETWDVQDTEPPAPPAPGAGPISPASVPPSPGSAQYVPGHASIPAPPPPAYPTQMYQPAAPPPTFSAPPSYNAGGAYGYPPEPPSKTGRTVAIVVGSLVVVLIAAGIIFVPKLLNKNNPNTNANGPTSAPATATTTTSPPTPPSIFAGTPAQAFANGADGIVLPAATAVTGFSKADVTNALNKVKQAMVAGRLDGKMVSQRDPSKLIAMLAPDARKGANDDFAQKKAFAYATKLQPETRLSNDPVKVKGKITFKAVTESKLKALQIQTDFIWVYPIQAQNDGIGANLIVVRDQIQWLVYANADVETSSQGLWIQHASAFGANLDCDAVDDDLVALAKQPVSEADTEAGSAYDLNADFSKVHFIC